MPAVFPSRLRPLLQLSFVLSLSASPVLMQSSWADDARRNYQVPAGSLSAALTRFAGLAGVNLSVDPALVSGRNSNGLAGEYGVEEGFTRLLSSLTEPFNVDGHAQASILIHEFAHQRCNAVDIASLEARRPFTDLIETITGQGAAMKNSQQTFQREALSLATPRQELFSRWSDKRQSWIGFDQIAEMSNVSKEILDATLSPTLAAARDAFLDQQTPYPRIETILRNADSIAFLICEMGRQLDPVPAVSP